MKSTSRIIRVLLLSFVVFCLFGEDDGCPLLAPSGLGTGGPTGGPPSGSPTPITATISASKPSDIQPGENVTFTAVASGGTPPYTYFWIMDNESAFTENGPNFTRQIDGSAPTRTVTLVVRDSTNTDSPYFSLSVTLGQLIPATGTVCGDMSGTWSSNAGTMFLTQTGNTVSGTYAGFCTGMISGTLSGGPGVSTACPDCLTWTGTWSQSGPGCAQASSGTFTFSVDPDLGHFNGRYTIDPNTHSEADFWFGDHDLCGDGSPAGPRQ